MQRNYSYFVVLRIYAAATLISVYLCCHLNTWTSGLTIDSIRKITLIMKYKMIVATI